MTRPAFVDREFSNVIIRATAITEDIEFSRCFFRACGVIPAEGVCAPGSRPVVSRLNIDHCKSSSCDVGPIIIRDSIVAALVTHEILLFWGSLFERVRWVGRCGPIRINKLAWPERDTEEAKRTQTLYDQDREAFYRSVDWALDISEARFTECSITGIPARLIRRNPETQVVVRREAALDEDKRARISAWNEWWKYILELYLDEGDEDCVLVTPWKKTRGQRDRLIRGLRELQELGIADLD